MEYHHKGSCGVRKRRRRRDALVGKVMAAVFWYSGGVIHMDCLEPETTINSKCCTAILTL